MAVRIFKWEILIIISGEAWIPRGIVCNCRAVSIVYGVDYSIHTRNEWEKPWKNHEISSVALQIQFDIELCHNP